MLIYRAFSLLVFLGMHCQNLNRGKDCSMKNKLYESSMAIMALISIILIMAR